MRHRICNLETLRRLPPVSSSPQGALVIGNLDGLHLGHRALLAQARLLGGPVFVVTFEPHPVQVLYPDRFLQTLFPRQDLAEQLASRAVDELLICNFDREFAKLSAADFLELILRQVFCPQHLVMGEDFCIGHNREGNVDYIKSWAAKYALGVHVVPPVRVSGLPVSSRRIRECVEKGDVRQAAGLLGRFYFLRGKIVPGAGRGAGLGFPTLNMHVEDQVIPAQGVYASRVGLNGQVPSQLAVTNIGVNPTFAGQKLKIETHVLDLQLPVPVQELTVALTDWVRGEKKFSGPEELSAQIARDIASVRAQN